MKTTKITIKNLFGIRETTLDGKSVEISGPKGSGKTSVLDAIRYALTNRSDRDYIVHQGADEGEIIIETNTGLSIDRKALPAKSAGTVKVRDGSMLQTRPAEFLAQIFTPLQLDPVKFTQLSRQEKNREILNLIEFQWDMNWIKEQFGEIPQGVDYGQHILEVLNDIQAENGIYFQSRQNINRDIRNKQAFIADIAKDIPSGYDYDRWNNYPSGEKYRELERLREQNSRIERAKAFRSGYDAKLRGLEAQRDMDLAAIDSDIARERASLTGTMERLKGELKATEEKLSGMEQRPAALAELKGEYHPPSSTALLVGGYIDAWFSGELPLYQAQHPEIFKRDGTLKAEYLRATEVVVRMQSDELYMLLMSGRKQVIRTGEIAGVPFKIKIDSLLDGDTCKAIVQRFPNTAAALGFCDGAIVDQKAMKDMADVWSAEDHCKIPFIEFYGYDIQGAIYQAIEGNMLPFVLAVGTKEESPDLEALYIADEDLAAKLAEVEDRAPRYQAIKEGRIQPTRCEHCDYCKATKHLTAILNYKELAADAWE